MGKMSVDAHEIRMLAEDLGRAPGRVVPRVRAVVEKGAHNVKQRMVADASKHAGHAKHFKNSISYDMRAYGSGWEAEIGPAKNRTQGALGVFLYFGSTNNAATLDIDAPLQAEAPAFEKHLGDLLEEAL